MKAEKDDNLGLWIIIIILAVLCFSIHLAFNVARGNENPVRTSVVDTFDPTKNFESEQ